MPASASLAAVVAPLWLMIAIAMPAAAQETGRWGGRTAAFDTVIGVQDFWGDAGQWPTQFVVDLSGTVEVAPGVQATVRPKLWRNRGEWKALLDQASIRYEVEKGSGWRVEAGRFPSPIGLGMTENRPNINPGVIWYHRPYYAPLPSLGATAPRASLVSSTYPYGVQVSTSARRWDARAGWMDRAPVEFWQQVDHTPRRSNVVVGAGLTPKQGLRIGVASAAGRLPAVAGDGGEGWRYRMVNVEGEFAFANTRLSGEWTHDVFAAPVQSHTAHGWTLQGRQTLTPRWFAHSRVSTVTAPAAVGATFVAREYRSVDTAVGYLVNPEITIRLGHAALKPYTRTELDHQVGVSLMWSRRWW
jgi:hypothetical protein